MSEPGPRYPWKEIPGSSHRVLLEKVLSRGEGLRLLDLGFGIGELAARVRDRCRYLGGVELDPEAAAQGLPYFDRALVGDLLGGLAAPWEVPFDVVVAGDILEHLADPGEALSRIRPLLAPGGVLILSLPNVANVTIRLSLLLGRFEYADRGILDRTHLRFFTRRTGQAFLESRGFRVRDVTATAMPAELAVPLLGRAPLAPIVRSGSLLLSRLWPGLFGYQFVYEAEVA